MTTTSSQTEVAIIGAGSVGIAVAYYLATRHSVASIALIDMGDPMALTSAQSGENYRNWWPHPVMTRFTDHSIDLMQEIATVTGNRIHMTRRGYALATRRTNAEALIADLRHGYGNPAGDSIRVHTGGQTTLYRPAHSQDWATAPSGVDVLLNRTLIAQHFPSFSDDVTAVLHIRRAGAISAQQMGAFMLESLRERGIRVQRAKLASVEDVAPFRLNLETADGPSTLSTRQVVNAAGPFVTDVASMLGETLPVQCVFQQKIAFEDRERAIPRAMPFAIDLDGQTLNWSEEERALLADDPETAALLHPMPGGIHCRPDGGDDSNWIKLGWAYNTSASDPGATPPLNPHFPDIVLRAASRLNPGLHTYLGRLPRNARHYGGYYAMTPENWPLIGPMRTRGAFIAGALSGFGTMAACATGALCAAWATGAELPDYAEPLSLARHDNAPLLAELAALNSNGVL